MMSINSAAISLGNAVGSALGGFMLVLFNYGAMASTLGAAGVIAAMIFNFLTIDISAEKIKARM